MSDSNDTQGAVPPYEGRTGGGSGNAETAASVERQLQDTKPGRQGSTASPPMESPVRPDELSDQAPETPLGVGESFGRRGENMTDKHDGKEKGRQDTGTSGADRPHGTSDTRDTTGI